MTEKLRGEMTEFIIDSIECGQIENDVSTLKAIIKEDHPRISKKDLDEAAKYYISVCWR